MSKKSATANVEATAAEATATEATAAAPAAAEPVVKSAREIVIEKIAKYLAITETKKAYDARRTVADNIIKLAAAPATFTVETVDRERKYHDNVEISLVNAISRFCGVKFFALREPTAQFMFVGTEEDTKVCREMVEVVGKQLKDETSAFVHAVKESGEALTAKKHAEFRRGFVERVDERLSKLNAMVVDHRTKQGLEPIDIPAASLESAEKYFVESNPTAVVKKLSHGVMTVNVAPPAAPAPTADATPAAA